MVALQFNSVISASQSIQTSLEVCKSTEVKSPLAEKRAVLKPEEFVLVGS